MTQPAPPAVLLLGALSVLTSCSAPRWTEKGIERAALGVTQAGGAPRRHALLIGVDTFLDPRFTPLRYAAADARELGHALTGYDTIRVLTAPDATLKASILSELEAVAAAATHPQDTVVVYVSSHGTLGRRPGGKLERFIVTRDTRMDVLAETAVAVDRLKSLLEGLPARRKALILALCHSGKGKSALDEPLADRLRAMKGPAAALHEVSEGLLVLTACAFGETARESEELGHDIYTAGILRALDRGDRDGDGAVTALEAHDFARDATYATTRGEQRPTAEVELVGRDPVVLRGEIVRTSAPVLYSYSPVAEGLRLSVDGVVKGTLPGGVSLSPGRREITLEDPRSGATLGRTTVLLAPGDRLDLTSVLPPAPGWSFGIAGRALFVFHDAIRLSALPFAAGPAAQLVRRFGAVSVGASVGYLTGTGQLRGIDEQLPFRSHVAELSAQLEWLPLPQLGIRVGLEGTWSIVIRDVSARDYRSVQAVGAPAAAVRAAWDRHLFRGWFGGLAIRAGVLGLRLERLVSVAPFIGAEVRLTWQDS